MENPGGRDGAQGRNRTTDTAIFSRMLYQLSYLGGSSDRARPARGSPRIVARFGPVQRVRTAKITGSLSLFAALRQAFIFLFRGDRIGTGKPPAEIDVGAPCAAERTIAIDRALATDRTGAGIVVRREGSGVFRHGQTEFAQLKCSGKPSPTSRPAVS